MNKSKRPFLNTPSACHRNAVRSRQPRFPAIPNRRHRARTAARVEPEGLRDDLRAFPPPRPPLHCSGTGEPAPCMFPSRIQSSGLGIFKAQKRDAARLGEGALGSRQALGALPPRARPAAPPRAAPIKAEALGGLICPLCPPKKRPNQNQGELNAGVQAAAAAARSLGSGEKGLALRAALKGASAQRGRGKRTKNPPKTVTKTHTQIKRNLENKERKHGAKPPATPAAPHTHSERRSPHTQQQQRLWLSTAAAPPRRPLYSSADLASGRAGREGGSAARAA